MSNAPIRDNNQRANYIPGWPAETFIVPLLRSRIVALVESCCAPHPGQSDALDVGCGMQPFRDLLQQAGYAYNSLDVVQNQIGTVCWTARIDGPLPAELSALRFDFILCTEVLEHVAEWELAWRNLADLLAPGGKLLVTCPHLYPLHEVPYDFWRPTPHTVRHFAEKNGLEIEFIEQAGSGREALGTVLSMTHFYSRDRRLTTRAKRWAAQRLRNFAMWALSHETAIQRVECRSPFYLSNIAVLRKPQHVA
jgi:SAM-dependent methyltransferase